MSDDTPKTDGPISYILDDGVAVISLDDGKANAVSHRLIEALGPALLRAEQEARAVVIVGRPGLFSAGFDLSVMTAGDEAMRGLVTAGAELFLRLFTLRVPLVMACTGHALAAGAVMLLTADRCVGTAGEFKIGLNEVSIGMPLPIFAVELARHRLSPLELCRATAHAWVYDPMAAMQAGYLHRIEPPEAVVAAAVEEARALGFSLKSVAYRRTKLMLRGDLADHVKRTLADDVASFSIG